MPTRQPENSETVPKEIPGAISRLDRSQKAEELNENTLLQGEAEGVPTKKNFWRTT